MKRLCAFAVLVVLAAGCGSDGSSRAEPNDSTTATEHSASTTASTTTTTAVEPGPTGPTGPTGAPGPAGISGYEVVPESQSIQTGTEQTGGFTVTASCPQGKRVIGGGAQVTVDPLKGRLSAFAWVEQSEPINESTWSATTGWGHFNGGATQTVTLNVKAICAFVG